jgi:hypothetical protein
MPEITRGGKVHDSELTAEATRLANLEGMRLSGQPWQEGAAGAPTAELLEQVHPDLAPDGVVSVVEGESGTTTPVEDAKAEKPAARTKPAKAKK